MARTTAPTPARKLAAQERAEARRADKKAALAERDELEKMPVALRVSARIEPVTLNDQPEGINLSELTEFNRCRYRWHLTYRRGIRRRGVQMYLDRGSAVHAGLQAGILHFWRGRTNPRMSKTERLEVHAAIREGVSQFAVDWRIKHGGVFSAEQEAKLADVCDEARVLAVRASDFLDIARWRPIVYQGDMLVERRVYLPFLDTQFHGTKDLVAEDREEGGVWVIDYKVRETFTNIESEQVDLQAAAYQYALAKLGIPTLGSVKIQIRGALPELPELTKAGTMSRRRIRCTWETYKTALRRAGLKPQDYQEEMEPKLDYEFFRMHRTYRNTVTQGAMFNDIIVPMTKVWQQAKTAYRHMNPFNCAGCWAKEFCLTELTYGDTDFLLQTDFVDTKNPAEPLILSPSDVILEDD